MSNLGKWEAVFRSSRPFPFGSELTYRIGAEFLAGCRTIHDWGCGTQWFRNVMREVNPEVCVTGLDGSAGFCDRIVDLRDYRPGELPDGLILRHVLELNFDWRQILDRALESFTHRMILILFTPTAEQETCLSEYSFPDGGRCPYLALPRRELEQIILQHGLSYELQTVSSSESEFGEETLIRIQRQYWQPEKVATGRFASRSESHFDPAEEFPFVSCLCPTYGRPTLLANALACYLAQDYPADRRELLILDDAGQYLPTIAQGWEIISIARRFRSLPEKFNALAGLARGELLVVWEDDDIYLPWHISAHACSQSTGLGYSKPSRVHYYAGDQLQIERATGRFHGSIAFKRKWLDRVQGWPLTRQADFDQQMMSRLARSGPTADPVERHPPSYVFRWESTNDYHGSETMNSPDDEEWYNRVTLNVDQNSKIHLQPKFDAHTIKCFADQDINDHILKNASRLGELTEESSTTSTES